MANRYWVGGTASWDGTAGTKWALTSGGAGGQAVPTSADDVFFSALSTGTCTIDTGNTGAKSINCTGFTGTITGTAAISVAGSITLFATQTYTHTGTVTLTGTGTLTTAGKAFSAVTVDGSGITVTLGDALNLSTRTLTITQGTFTTSASNYNITAGSLSSSNSNIRTITLNGSTITLSTGSSGTLTFDTSTNLTFNANTSTINCSNPNVLFRGGGQTFNNVSFTATSNTNHLLTGNNTFANFTMADRSANGTARLSIGGNQTITGTFTINGTQTSVPRRIWIRSNIFGTNRTINAAAINLYMVDFRNITGAGAASWNDSSRTNYWGDAGGNSGITFATGRNAYWNLAGTQSWAANAWALTNNGAPAAANYPLVQDTATFTEAGAAGTVQLDTQGQMIGNLTMADGVSNRTSAMTLNFFSADQDNFFGNITLFSNLTLTGGTKVMRLCGYANTQQITTAGVNLSVVNVNTQEGYNNTVQLQDNLLLASNRSLSLLNESTFNANNFNVTAGSFIVNNSSLFGLTEGTTKTLTMGSGTWTLSGTGTVWNIQSTTGLTLNANTSTIVLSDTSTTARSFNGGSRTYNNLTIGGATGTSTLTITGTNTFATLASTKTVAHTITFPNDTTTVSNWTATGTVGNVLTLTRTGGSGTFTLAKSGGGAISGVDYLSISNSTASPTNTWYAGANSTDGGGNTNWQFTVAPVFGSASISGSATLTALANYTALSSASITGSATVTGLANRTTFSSGSISASATVSTLGNIIVSANALINATATVSAIGGLLISRTASINGTATASASGNLVKLGVGYINGTASVSAFGVLLNSGQASITANGTVTAKGGLLISRTASINGTATVTADGYYIADGVAAISAYADVTALGGRVLGGVAGITANGTVIAKGTIQGEGWNPITPSSDTWTDASPSSDTWTTISPSSDTWLRQG